MEKHAIESIMNATMESIRDMVDVNTVIGEPVTASDGTTVIPVSRVSFGFVAGGGDYELSGKKSGNGHNGQGGQNGQQGGGNQGGQQESAMPFAGGAGAGVSVSPVGFLVVSSEQVRLLPVQPYAPLDRIIELAPQLVQDCKRWMAKKNPPPDHTPSNPSSGPLD
jgi:sporulation protein YtfJ